jgi:hypothetical protein
MDALPLEIFASVIEFLDVRSLLDSILVCQDWHDFINSPTMQAAMLRIYGLHNEQVARKYGLWIDTWTTNTGMSFKLRVYFTKARTVQEFIGLIEEILFGRITTGPPNDIINELSYIKMYLGIPRGDNVDLMIINILDKLYHLLSVNIWLKFTDLLVRTCFDCCSPAELKDIWMNISAHLDIIVSAWDGGRSATGEQYNQFLIDHMERIDWNAIRLDKIFRGREYLVQEHPRLVEIIGRSQLIKNALWPDTLLQAWLDVGINGVKRIYLFIDIINNQSPSAEFMKKNMEVFGDNLEVKRAWRIRLGGFSK